MEKQINNFLEFIQNDKKASENTLQSYKRDIVQYQRYIEENKINYIVQLFQEVWPQLEHFISIY